MADRESIDPLLLVVVVRGGGGGVSVCWCAVLAWSQRACSGDEPVVRQERCEASVVPAAGQGQVARGDRARDASSRAML